MAIPITPGTGATSVASEAIGGSNYQQIKVVGGETGSTSVWGITPDGSAKVSVIGRVAADISGSVAAIITGTPSISGAVTIVGTPTVNIGTIPGSVIAFQGGTQITSLVGTVPSSIQVGASIMGHAPVVIVGGSIAAAVTPPANQSVSGTVDVNVLNTNVNVSGSVVGFQGTNPWVIGSVVGTYAEDAAHTTGDKGIFVLGVRNDTMASVTSADLDYSPNTVGPVGELVTANAPITKWVQGTADLRVVLGASVTAIAAQGASIFTYITAVQVANMGSASVLVTLAGGLGSILGYTIAPAGGGSNIIYPNALKTGANSAFTASISGTASVLVSAQGFISKT